MWNQSCPAWRCRQGCIKLPLTSSIHICKMPRQKTSQVPDRIMPVYVWDTKQHVWDSGLQIIGHNVFNCLQNTSHVAIGFCWAFSCPKRQAGGLASAGSKAPKPPSILNFLQHMVGWSNTVKTNRDLLPSWALRTIGDGEPWKPYGSTERCT